MGNKEFRARFIELFKGRLTLKKGVGTSEMDFISRIAQDPQYSDILRTFKAAYDQPTDEGYTFKSSD